MLRTNGIRAAFLHAACRERPPCAELRTLGGSDSMARLSLRPFSSVLVVITVAAVLVGSALLLFDRHWTVHAAAQQLKIAYSKLPFSFSFKNGFTGRVGLVPIRPANGAFSPNSCAPTAVNPSLYGCFTGNSPYRHTVASLLKAGATVHTDATAVNYWNNGYPLTADNINANGYGATKMWIASSSDPMFNVTCPAYNPDNCTAATSRTGRKVHIPSQATPTSDSDHHIFIFDLESAEEVDMWGGYDPNQACQIGSYRPGVLTCSWGGTFPFSGNGLAAVAGNSGIAGDVAYGMVAITASDILSGHIRHALGIIEPCLDDNGQYPSTPGRGSDAHCRGNASGGGDGAEPTLRYGDMIHLKSSIDLSAPPYSEYTPYCRVVVKALQEYGAYADDNSNGYGLHLISVNQTDPGWQTIMESMIAGGDASGSATSASWDSCFNRIRGSDLETITLKQGDGTIAGGNAVLPPITSP
jgi:hypothetical protein